MIPLQLLTLALLVIGAHAGSYLIGSGIADVTGEVTEAGFMGYAVTSQKGSGLHFRLYARAFIIVDPNTQTRVAYVSLDLCMGFQMMKTEVISKLQSQYGDLYTDKNVIISGTHTHSTPGGLGGTILVDITTFGFLQHNFDAACNGIVAAISQAHESLTEGDIKINWGKVDAANINRSPTSYLKDPEAERAQYLHDTDHNMTVLRFEADDGTPVGMANFFAVHGTSMNLTNTLVSGDNKGVASMLFEEAFNPAGTLPGKGKFVAAFGQSNEGDVSPNTRGPSCPDGSPCDLLHSTCNGRTQGCTAKGPGKDMQESCLIIGTKQFEAARDLYNNATTKISGPVDFRHTYIDMKVQTVRPEFSTTGETGKTCTAAMGYSFAAGTTDGPGDFDFTQGTNSTNPFWAFVSGFLSKPTQAQIDCHHPKPILLNLGSLKPSEWAPSVLPLQIVRVGQLWIVAFPGEATTMSGRRLRLQVKNTLIREGVWTDDMIVVIAGLSNSYSHYTATYEEYQAQRYEAASTLYGPFSLDAYRQTLDALATALAHNITVPSGPTPPNHLNHTISFHPGVVVDSHPIGGAFGKIQTDVQSSYAPGTTARVTFWGASPRNDLQTGKTYLTVEKKEADGSFTVVRTDGNWDTKFHWARHSVSESLCTVEWDIPAGTPAGTYRIQHFGVSKSLLQTKTPYQGTSSEFTVTA